MPKIYESNILSNLGDMSGQHKLLYLALWELANAIGIVEVNLPELGALAGDHKYHRSDLAALGNRIVWLDASRVILPKYLTTTIGRLSPSSRGQQKVFDLIYKEWGATRENLGPFYDAWRAMGILLHAPKAIEVYQGENMPLPKHVADHRKEVETSRNVLDCGTFTPEIAEHFSQYFEVMYANAMKQITATGCAKHRWNSKIVEDNQRAIQTAINKNKDESKIISSIRKAKNGLHQTILI
jgi:hypothetical protein